MWLNNNQLNDFFGSAAVRVSQTVLLRLLLLILSKVVRSCLAYALSIILFSDTETIEALAKAFPEEDLGEHEQLVANVTASAQKLRVTVQVSLIDDSSHP
jgi:hypothetical protein